MYCGTEKATKLLAELDSKKGIGLIERRKQGQGKPAIIYLKKFTVSDRDNKQNLRLSEIENQDFRDTKGNYNNINNTELSNTEISYHINPKDDVKRWIEERQSYESLIKQNIEYDFLVLKYEKVWLDEIVSLMVDVVCSKEQYIRINKQEYPQEIVKSRFLKLKREHIEYINLALQNNTSDVRNIRAFLITTIYRSAETQDNWYAAKVLHDMIT